MNDKALATFFNKIDKAIESGKISVVEKLLTQNNIDKYKNGNDTWPCLINFVCATVSSDSTQDTIKCAKKSIDLCNKSGVNLNTVTHNTIYTDIKDSPLDYYARKGQLDMYNYIHSLGARSNSSLNIAIRHGHDNLIENIVFLAQTPEEFKTIKEQIDSQLHRSQILAIDCFEKSKFKFKLQEELNEKHDIPLKIKI